MNVDRRERAFTSETVTSGSIVMLLASCVGLAGCDSFESSANTGGGGAGAQSSSSTGALATTASTTANGTTTAGMEASSASTGPMPTCVPSDPNWTPNDGCGVFVRAGSNGVGTPDDPMGSLAAAVDAAEALGKPVYLSEGAYPGAVTLPSGQIVYGGLTAQWAFDAGIRPTILGASDEIPVRLAPGALTTELHHLQVEAASAVVAGGSSIAVLVDDTPSLFETVTLTAGNGKAGTSSTTPNGILGPTNPNDATIRGKNGQPGDMSTVTVALPGGAATSNPTCVASVGGQGGSGGTVALGMASAGGTGSAGQTALAGCMGASCGAGGHGEDNGAFPTCASGQNGASGMNGPDGVAETGVGVLDATGYVAPLPVPGMDGGHGQGGGGSGGALGVVDAVGPPFNHQRGASGGGGGAGGCGGKGSAGGGSGGSSIALVALTQTPTLVAVTINFGDGGDGGDAAAGQSGAIGGNGGDVGVGGDINNACDGGAGGAGGRGGAGAGGRGGHAIGIAVNGTLPPSGFSIGASGTGGSAGNSPVNGGVAGESQDRFDFVP